MTKMSRGEVEALISIQDEMTVLSEQALPTPSGRWRLTITSYDTGGGGTPAETRELVDLLIGTARELEGLT